MIKFKNSHLFLSFCLQLACLWYAIVFYAGKILSFPIPNFSTQPCLQVRGGVSWWTIVNNCLVTILILWAFLWDKMLLIMTCCHILPSPLPVTMSKKTAQDKGRQIINLEEMYFLILHWRCVCSLRQHPLTQLCSYHIHMLGVVRNCVFQVISQQISLQALPSVAIA